jgi:hypothetical protein
MKHLLLALTLACSGAFANDTPPPPAGPIDRGGEGKHFVLSFVIGVAAGEFLHKEPLWVRYAAAITPGLGKELTDRTFSRRDMGANMLGAALGLTFHGLVLRKHGDTVQVSYAVPLP